MNANADEQRRTELLEEIAANTGEIAAWLQVAYGGDLKEKLETLLDDPRKLVAYEYSDGENSTRAVGQVAGVSEKAIRGWWREWMDHDIVEPTSVQGRFRRRFSLRRLGMDVPSAVAVNDAKQGDQQ